MNITKNPRFRATMLKKVVLIVLMFINQIFDFLYFNQYLNITNNCVYYDNFK